MDDTLTAGIDPSLQGAVHLGLLLLRDVRVAADDGRLAAEVDEACASFRRRHGGVSSGSVPGVEDARRLYKSLGIDPTRTRPSNEALLRRALKGEALYRINTAVDAINLCSLVQQLPYGLYDADQIEPPILLRTGAADESYEGIRKGTVALHGRPLLADRRGPFGNPTSDSARTSVGLTTRALLITLYAPRFLGPERLEPVLGATLEVMTRHCGGTCVLRRLL